MEYDIHSAVMEGHTYLGIELGSTRIKSVLIGMDYAPIASGVHTWENRLVNGVWTYDLEDVWEGIQVSFARLVSELKSKYGVQLTTLGGVGISAMMHGYLPFDHNGKPLTEFRSWRNVMTEEASARLTEAFGFNVPLRWSVAHLFQAVMNGEAHIYDIARLTTLAGYVHEQLTGQNVLGVGEASGMFPVDGLAYDAKMLAAFDKLAEPYSPGWNIADILPRVLNAGEAAGSLTPEGARRLDPTGRLSVGIPFCPPEGDAGTGMVATNSVAPRTGNISAGTSVFAMAVLEKPLSKVYPEVDIVTTPTGKPVAMIHCNNCTSDMDAWVELTRQAIELAGAKVSLASLYDAFYGKALEGDYDCGGMLAYNYVSGEPITGMKHGRPLFVRMPDSPMSFPNFARAQLYSAIATLRLGMDILEQENVTLDRLMGHGGFFKTGDTGQRLMAASLNVPVTVLGSAAEGGAWGGALLAAYHAQRVAGETLEAFLENRVFADRAATPAVPDPDEAQSFSAYMERYKKGLAIERTAVDVLD